MPWTTVYGQRVIQDAFSSTSKVHVIPDGRNGDTARKYWTKGKLKPNKVTIKICISMFCIKGLTGSALKLSCLQHPPFSLDPPTHCMPTLLGRYRAVVASPYFACPLKSRFLFHSFIYWHIRAFQQGCACHR